MPNELITFHNCYLPNLVGFVKKKLLKRYNFINYYDSYRDRKLKKWLSCHWVLTLFIIYGFCLLNRKKPLCRYQGGLECLSNGVPDSPKILCIHEKNRVMHKKYHTLINKKITN